MSKGEDLFEDVDLDAVLNDSDEGVDTSEFTQEPGSEDDSDNEENPPANEQGDDEDSDTPPEEDGVDTSEFEKDINTDNKNSVDDNPSADDSSSPLQLIASTLQAEGVIDLKEGEEITSSKQILDAVRSKISENEYADMNDDQKTYVEALRAGIPDEVIKQNFNNIKALNGITPEAIEGNEDLRRTLITQGLIAEGLSEAKAVKSANRIVEAGDDLEEAKEAYSSLKSIESKRVHNETERLKTEAKNKAAEDSEKLKALKTKVLETEEFIPAFKTNSATREKVYNLMTKVAGHDKEGNPLNAINMARHKDPERMEMMENYMFNITNGYTDFTTLKGKMKTSNIKELDKKLKGNQSGGGISKSISKEVGGGLAGALENLKL
jgi:hypothetical protein